MLVYETERLMLERIQAEHAALLIVGLQNPALYQFMDGKAPESEAALHKRYSFLAGGKSPDGKEAWLNWAIRLRTNSEYIGFVQATVKQNLECDIAYVIFTQFQGRGYAREASQKMLTILRSDFPIKRFRATVDTRNLPSIALLEHLGFYLNGVTDLTDDAGNLESREAEYLLAE